MMNHRVVVAVPVLGVWTALSFMAGAWVQERNAQPTSALRKLFIRQSAWSPDVALVCNDERVFIGSLARQVTTSYKVDGSAWLPLRPGENMMFHADKSQGQHWSEVTVRCEGLGATGHKTGDTKKQ